MASPYNEETPVSAGGKEAYGNKDGWREPRKEPETGKNPNNGKQTRRKPHNTTALLRDGQNEADVYQERQRKKRTKKVLRE